MMSIKINSLVIVGVARNCAKTLRSDILRIENAFSCVQKISWVVIESDSEDETVQVLTEMQHARFDFQYISLGALRHQYPKRTERIAVCRNEYLKFVFKNEYLKNYEFMAVADLDGINSELTVDAVRTCLERNDWDVCCANQDGPYYDVWALRHHLWSPNDCWAQVVYMQALGVELHKAVSQSVHSRMLEIPKSADWIEVDSAFGGLAIYRLSVIKSATYNGLAPNGDEVCEHVCFNSQIKSNGGRIFINPSFINASVTEHSCNTSYRGAVLFFLRCKLCSIIRKLRMEFFLKIKYRRR